MERRSFLQSFVALFTLRPAIARTECIPADSINPLLVSDGLTDLRLRGSEEDESALLAWKRLPMQPLVSPDDLPVFPNPQHLVGFMLLLYGTQIDIGFRYSGGSQPGADRLVRPILLFRKIDPKLDPGAQSNAPVYLLAFCRTRNEPRTFRLDRMLSMPSPLSVPNAGSHKFQSPSFPLDISPSEQSI
jgi:hypothetical protein